MKEEEQKNFEQAERGTESDAQNKNLNFIQKNPQSVGAIFLGLLTFVLMFLNLGFIWVIPIIFGARRLLKAKKNGENKKIIIIGYVIVYLPVLSWILSSVLFATNAVNNVRHESREEKFKEVTTAYETLMSEYDDQDFQDQKSKIENYIKLSSSFETMSEEKTPEGLYYNFGKIFKVEDLLINDLGNPHLVASKHLYQGFHGDTSDILKIIPAVEVDNELAKSFMYYVDDFFKLPNSCQLDINNVYIKFAGIIHKKDVSAWYYYLVNQYGELLLNNSWISLHRSNDNGLCALTGIFLNSKECSPEGTINTEEDYSFLPINELDVK